MGHSSSIVGRGLTGREALPHQGAGAQGASWGREHPRSAQHHSWHQAHTCRGPRWAWREQRPRSRRSEPGVLGRGRGCLLSSSVTQPFLWYGSPAITWRLPSHPAQIPWRLDQSPTESSAVPPSSGTPTSTDLKPSISLQHSRSPWGGAALVISPSVAHTVPLTQRDLATSFLPVPS